MPFSSMKQIFGTKQVVDMAAGDTMAAYILVADRKQRAQPEPGNSITLQHATSLPLGLMFKGFYTPPPEYWQHLGLNT